MFKLLILYYVLIEITMCLGDCGTPGQPANGHVYGLKERSSEGNEVVYSCKDNYRLIGDHKRTCMRGIWTGEVPRCAMPILEQDLTIEKIKVEHIKVGKYGSSQHNEPNNISQLLIDFNDQDQCFESYTQYRSHVIQVYFYFSPPTPISFIQLYLNRSVKHIPNIKVIDDNEYESCVQTGGNLNNEQVSEFECGIKETLNGIFPGEISSRESISFEFSSDRPNSIRLPSICKLKLYQTHDCGLIDIPLHTSVNYTNSRKAIFSLVDQKAYKLVGDDTVHCTPHGQWFPSPPLVRSLFCSIDKALIGNNTDYILDIKDGEYHNGKIVGKLNTKLIYKCINHTETSQSRNQITSGGLIETSNKSLSETNHFIQYCDGNGNWKGRLPNCPRMKNVTDELEIEEKRKKKGERGISLMMILISLVSSLAIVLIAIVILVYYIFRKKKQNEEKRRENEKRMRFRDSIGNEIYYDDGESGKRGSGLNYEPINIGDMILNPYEVIQDDGNNYDELNVERYDNVKSDHDNNYDDKDIDQDIHQTKV